MENELIGIATQTFMTAYYISFPMLMGGLVAGLLISIFQATTQINEMTLSFVPKIVIVAGILILLMPWISTIMIDFTLGIFNKIPSFIQ